MYVCMYVCMYIHIYMYVCMFSIFPAKMSEMSDQDHPNMSKPSSISWYSTTMTITETNTLRLIFETNRCFLALYNHQYNKTPCHFMLNQLLHIQNLVLNVGNRVSWSNLCTNFTLYGGFLCHGGTPPVLIYFHSIFIRFSGFAFVQLSQPR